VFIERPQMVDAVFLAFFLANLMMLPLGFLAIRLSRQILRIPHAALMPIIMLFCVVGSFAINNSSFDVMLMLILGVMAFIMEENGFPIAPVILGIVLGVMVEDNFITSMIKSDGSFLTFFERPIAAVLGITTLLIWFVPMGLQLYRRKKTAKA